MKKLKTTFGIIFLLLVGIQFISNAQVNNSLSKSELVQALENRSENEKKISSNLYSKIFQYQKNLAKGMSVQKATESFSSKHYFIDNEDRLLIIIRFENGNYREIEKVKNIISNSGGRIKSEGPGHNNLFQISCWMPVGRIIDLASSPDVVLIEVALAPVTRVTTAGYTQLKASNVFNSMGLTGNGIKIGVMSDGAQNWEDAWQAHPAELGIVNIVEDGIPEGYNGEPLNEGTAMLEIIYDLAPNAQLYFSGLGDYDGGLNLNERANRISALATSCSIIVDDIWGYYEPFFSDESVLGTAIKDFINNGNIYISASGNERKKCLSGKTNFVGIHHIFPSNDDYYRVTIKENDVILLQWATSWQIPTTDFDLELYNLNNELELFSNFTQSVNNPPYEIIDVANYISPGDYRIKIKSNSGPSNNVDFKIVIPDNNFVNETLTNQIFGISAYPNVISVAAYEASNQTTTSSFSSIGPGVMYSSTTNSVTVQNVPTITATSGVETWVGTTNLWPGGNPVFSGTSAAAPHIAGLAALYFEALNNKSNFDFIEDLKSSASTIGSETGGVWDEKSGWGKADILAAINLNVAVATPVIEPSGGYYGLIRLPITISCSTPGATIYYTLDDTEPSETNGIEYQGQFEINTQMISTVIKIKAKAIKDDQESSQAEELYIFNASSNVATVFPGSGTYPVGTKITISWPEDYECVYTREIGVNPPEPPKPESAPDGAYYVYRNPDVWTLYFEGEIEKIKFQLRKNGNWQSPVVYVQYDVKPALRIAQVDDEITQGDNSFGFWNLWENEQWNPYPDQLFIRPETSTDYFVKAQQNYKENTTRKYNVWTKNSGENHTINHAQIPVDANTSAILAHFKETYNATVQNKLEGILSLNEGHFLFSDPWYPNYDSGPKGMRNGGTDQIPVQMNFQTSPNITTDSEHKGVFLNQGYDPVNQEWTPPYYKVKAPQQTININGNNHQIYFLNWSATNAALQNFTSTESGVVFYSDNAVVTANYKGSKLSTTTNAFGGSSQRKIARTSDGYYHLVYESMGRVWYETKHL